MPVERRAKVQRPSILRTLVSVAFAALASGIVGNAAGVAIALGGALRDGISTLAVHGAFGEVLVSNVTGYSFVYHLELYLLFAALIAIGPLVRSYGPATRAPANKFGLADLPG